MSLTRSVAHNTIVQLIGRGISILLNIVVFFFVARHLGVAGYGTLTTITAFLQFFGLAADLGLYIYLTKSLGDPHDDHARTVSNVFTLRLVSGAFIIGLAPIVVLLFPYPASVKIGVALMALSSLSVTLTQSLAGIFQKALRTSRFIASEVLGRIVLLGATIIAIRSGAGVFAIVLTMVLGSVVTFLSTYVTASRIMPVRLRFDWSVWKSILATTWPIGLSILFNVVYFKADTIILSLYHPAHDVGIYGAPYRILEALISIPAMFAGLLTPILAGAFATDRARFTRVLQRGFDALCLAAAPLIVGVQFVANDLMRLIAPDYAASGPVLRLLIVAMGAVFLGYLFSNTIIVVNRQRQMLWAYAALAILSFVLYVIFIPPYSYFGAAYVTVAVEGAIALLSAIIVLKASRTRIELGTAGKILIASAVMAAAMWLGRSLPWYVNGMVGTLAYLMGAYSLNVFDRETLREVFSRGTP